jgi:hypothetical protein
MTQPHDHVLDEGGVEVVALGERLQDLAGEVGGVPARQPPVALAAGGADGVDDHGVDHEECSLGWVDGSADGQVPSARGD